MQSIQYIGDNPQFELLTTFRAFVQSYGSIKGFISAEGMLQTISQPLQIAQMQALCSTTGIELRLYAAQAGSNTFGYTGISIVPAISTSNNYSFGTPTVTFNPGTKLALILNVTGPTSNPIYISAKV